MTRLRVPKTYKLFIRGAFPRSESGRVYEVVDPDGAFLANAALASRKDARDAVQAARAAHVGWAGATAYNRGQVLYRVAEMLEGRAAQFVRELTVGEGLSEATAGAQVTAAIDRWVWYAGWADKYAQLAGSGNPVSGPFFNISVPEPSGVVAIVAPETPSLMGITSLLAPVLVSGNSAVVVGSFPHPLTAITLAEVIATSDVPGGVVNILTGSAAEIVPWLASHADVDALDLSGAGKLDWVDYEIAAAETLTRVRRPELGSAFASDATAGARKKDNSAQLGEDPYPPSLERILAFTETKTIWHTASIA